jgi:hypothetical protein
MKRTELIKNETSRIKMKRINLILKPKLGLKRCYVSVMSCN